jgi:hypothetical protein
MALDNGDKTPLSPLTIPVKKAARILSDGYYGATYMPEAAGQSIFTYLSGTRL